MLMILTDKVKVKINNKNIDHFLSQNLEVVYGGIYDMEVRFLPKYSKYKILAKCNSCGNEKDLSMQKYTMNMERHNTYNCKSCNNITYRKSMIIKYGEDNPSKIYSCNEKRKKTCKERYGSEYIISSQYSKDKTKQTLFDRYGGHQSRVKEIIDRIVNIGIETKIKRGIIVPENELTEWLLYRRLVRKFTERNRNKLLQDWDGLDYYDGEYIKDNFNLKFIDLCYPTLDHKLSLFNGFKNKISVDEISGIDNLCITKRKINSSKSHLNEYDYKKKTDI